MVQWLTPQATSMFASKALSPAVALVLPQSGGYPGGLPGRSVVQVSNPSPYHFTRFPTRFSHPWKGFFTLSHHDGWLHILKGMVHRLWYLRDFHNPWAGQIDAWHCSCIHWLMMTDVFWLSSTITKGPTTHFLKSQMISEIRFKVPTCVEHSFSSFFIHFYAK